MDKMMYRFVVWRPHQQLSFEIARVLKPGGVYLLTDYRDPERVQELFKRDEWEGGTLT